MITAAGVSEHSADALPALLARDDGLVWVDIPGCDPQAVHVLSEVFRFHPMAVQDCVERNRVPKMHAYSDHVLVVLHAPERGERGHVHYVELDQIIGRNYLVTVHGPVNPAVPPEVPLRETSQVLARLRSGRLRPVIPFDLSYAIASALIRNQEDYVEAVTSQVWHLEQRVTGGEPDDALEFLNELFQARHGLLAVRTMATLSGAIYGRVAALTAISDAGKRLAADLADKFERVRAVADGEREYLQGVIEYYHTVLVIKAALIGQAQNEEVQRLTAASYAQNEQVKKISAWAAIFFAPSLIGTVYGMNFIHMPELHWTLGYPLALVLMLASSAALYLFFKRRGWL
ncbi:magnesium transporter CorA family protein [Dactylosporangium sp. NPDC049140]|uniref:magnesium transporter CorA family protein n=1 Tax=Dactylosporangium sp. NPDC049140 TaxID=3155647 RepID=UPI0033D512FE